MFRALYIINLILVLGTTLGWITIFLGAFGMIVTGIAQVIFFLILLYYFQHLNSSIQRHLKIYGTMLIVMILFYWNMDNIFRLSESHTPALAVFLKIGTVIFPMCISYYFTWILWWARKTKIAHYNNTNDDTNILDRPAKF